MDVEDWVEIPTQKKKTHGVRDVFSFYFLFMGIWGGFFGQCWLSEAFH